MSSGRERCPTLEEIEVLLRLRSGDPRRRHVDTCPRCRARAITFHEFVTPPDDLPPDLLREADSKLEAALRRELGHPAPPWRRWLGSLALPRTGRDWAFAALGLVVLAGSAGLFLRSRSPEPFLIRGNELRNLHGASTPGGLRSEPEGDHVTLYWSVTSGADAYEVRIYATDLTEIARLHPTTEVHTSLTRADFTSFTPTGTRALWKVVALRHGDPLAESAPAALRLP